MSLDAPQFAYTAPPRGCICPPTSERTCRAPACPRQGVELPNDNLAAIEERLAIVEEEAARAIRVLKGLVEYFKGVFA